MIVEDETFARRILAIPSIVVVLFYAVLLALPRLLLPNLNGAAYAFFSALFGLVFWIPALGWAFALFLVAHTATRSGSGLIARALFAIAGVLLMAALVVDMRIELPEQRLDLGNFIRLFGAVFVSATCIGLAASKLDTFEGGSGWLLKDSVYNTCFAILFLPVGIWFLRRRVERLLTQTAQP